MKKLLYSLLMVAAITACDTVNSDLTNEFDYDPFVSVDAGSITVAEDAEAGQATVNIILTGPAQSSAITVELSVTTSDNAAGNVTLPSSNTVTIPAGEFSAPFTISYSNNDSPDGDKSVTVSIVSATGVAVATEGTERVGATILIADDDCDIPNLAGDYSVVTTETSPGGCAGVTNEVTITLVEDLGNFQYVYELSDVTGGLYPNCYQSADNPGQFSTDVFAISMVDQPDVVYGGDVFNGSGTLDCDGNFVLTWSNGFGDAGTSTFTRL
ncbi:hypothetical protein [uncultured Marivirga sp.]|uniref:hypothetical protein n=1 Tax=uncultured Marivirga sp. TaxID=1123707 RepID=UPI0030EE9938|tara:strand:+ start:70765 stop:71571 length:807 start_codon:yes stop_codon:yes gene_type:complete